MSDFDPSTSSDEEEQFYDPSATNVIGLGLGYTGGPPSSIHPDDYEMAMFRFGHPYTIIPRFIDREGRALSFATIYNSWVAFVSEPIIHTQRSFYEHDLSQNSNLRDYINVFSDATSSNQIEAVNEAGQHAIYRRIRRLRHSPGRPYIQERFMEYARYPHYNVNILSPNFIDNSDLFAFYGSDEIADFGTDVRLNEWVFAAPYNQRQYVYNYSSRHTIEN